MQYIQSDVARVLFLPILGLLLLSFAGVAYAQQGGQPPTIIIQNRPDDPNLKIAHIQPTPPNPGEPASTDSTKVSNNQTDSNQEDAFSKCASEFFGPKYPSTLKSMGVDMDIEHAYLWFTITVPSLSGWRDVSDFWLQKRRKYFTDKGWQDYKDYIAKWHIADLLAANNHDTIFRSFLHTSPLLSGEKPSGRWVLSADMHSTYILRGTPKNPSQVHEYLWHVDVAAIRSNADGTFLIDQWAFKPPAQELK